MPVINDLDALADPFKAKAYHLVEIIEREGLPFYVFETARPFSRSAELFMKGRDYVDGVLKVVDKKAVVSNARAGESPHNWRLALDCVLIHKDHSWWSDGVHATGPWDTGYDAKGHLVRPIVKLAWERYGRAVRQADLTWGGDWVSWKDMPHAELKAWKTLRPSDWKAVALREVQLGR